MCNRVLLLFGKMPQWNLYINCHVNGKRFQSGLRFQTGLSSLRVSCIRAFTKDRLNIRFVKKIPLTIVIGQQMNKEEHDQNYWSLLNFTFHLFDTYVWSINNVFWTLSIKYTATFISGNFYQWWCGALFISTAQRC